MCLACARTIHKFQGLTAGPVDEAKVKNMFEVIVCDPDDGMFERSALGILYTAVSRATTLGDADGKNSAIYFMGQHMNERRVRRIGKKKDSMNDYKRVIERREWVQFLSQRKRKCRIRKRRKEHVLQWANTSKFNFHHLSDRIEKYIYQQRAFSGRQCGEKECPNKRQCQVSIQKPPKKVRASV